MGSGAESTSKGIDLNENEASLSPFLLSPSKGSMTETEIGTGKERGEEEMGV